MLSDWEIYLIIAIAVVVLGVVAAVVFIRRAKRGRPGVAAPAAELPAAPATLQESLTRTRQGLLGRLRDAWTIGGDAEARLARLEEVLITADIGVKATQELIDKLRPQAREL